MKYLSSVIFLLLFVTTAFAGGWPQPKGHGFFKLSEWWIVSNQHYTDQGRIDPNLTNGIFNTSIYAEYGFTNKLTGIIYAPIYSRSLHYNTVSATTGEVMIPGEAVNSIGDFDVSVKYGLIDGPIVLSTTLTLGLPFGNDGGGSLGILQTGDGEFNQMLRVDAGTGFNIGQTTAYATAYAGYNNRTNGFSDEFRFGIEAGINLFKNRFTAIARLYGVQSLQNGELGIGENSTSIFANNSEHLTFGPEIAYNFNDTWGISAGIGTALSGKLIYAAPSYNVGVFFKLIPNKKKASRYGM